MIKHIFSLLLTIISLFSCSYITENKIILSFVSEDDVVIETRIIKKGDKVNYFPDMEKRQGYVILWNDSTGKIYKENSEVTTDTILFPVYYKIQDILGEVKSICFFGDSIGAGVGWSINNSDYPQNYTAPFEKYGSYTSLGYSGGWAYLFASEYNCSNVVNVSVGGAHFSGEICVGPYYYEEFDYISQYYDCFNIIVIETTFNDIDSVSINQTTVNQSLIDFEYMINCMMEFYPNSKILVINSPDGRYQRLVNEDLTFDTKQLLEGYSMICREKSIPYFNLREAIGLLNELDDYVYSLYYPDGIHPSEDFYRTCLFPEIKSFIAENLI